MGLGALGRLARQHKAQGARSFDPELAELLQRRRDTPREFRRDVDRRNFQLRRRLKRRRLREAVDKVAEDGEAPPQPRTANHVSWAKMFGDADPATVIHGRFETIYSLDGAERDQEVEEKQNWMQRWLSLRIDMKSHRVTEQRMLKLISKLKRCKGSPDGVTAEMFQALPEMAMRSLALYLAALLSTLAFLHKKA